MAVLGASGIAVAVVAVQPGESQTRLAKAYQAALRKRRPAEPRLDPSLNFFVELRRRTLPKDPVRL